MRIAPRWVGGLPAATFAGLALLTSGCGDGDTTASPLLRDVQRASEADDVYGSRFAFHGRSVTDEGDVRFRGYGQVEAGEVRSRAVTNGDGRRIEFIWDGPYVFDFNPGDVPDVPPGTKWIRAKVADLHRRGGLRGFESLGPTESLKLLVSLRPTVEKAGTETVDGVRTTRYVMRATLRALRDAIIEPTTGKRSPSDAQADDEIRFVFSIDARHLVRRARVSYQSTEHPYSVVSEITRYDRDVHVDVPRSPTVFDATR